MPGTFPVQNERRGTYPLKSLKCANFSSPGRCCPPSPPSSPALGAAAACCLTQSLCQRTTNGRPGRIENLETLVRIFEDFYNERIAYRKKCQALLPTDAYQPTLRTDTLSRRYEFSHIKPASRPSVNIESYQMVFRKKPNIAGVSLPEFFTFAGRDINHTAAGRVYQGRSHLCATLLCEI
ncbi:hypothetical protein EVAR_8544_1 [Eumeta japonica]|uniref:Uncharacterized protein n=1 Tax=Eumeta variegata TaxID=151549 RepID=A0A4C1TXS3_EUMVA|nr:hypothetical protein EVAR_8544_1 [Eumeta japonica]